MPMQLDPCSGLYLPEAPARKRFHPNPESMPPVDPSFVYKLNRIADRVGYGLRVYWMKEMRIYGIQSKRADGLWVTEFAAYDAEAACEGNPYPFMVLDDRVLKEFCEASLEIQYGTGDLKKDMALRDAAKDAEIEQLERKEHQESLDQIMLAVTGNDPKRFDKWVHSEPGLKFTGGWPGADLSKASA